MRSWIFSIISPVFKVTWSFRNHSDMLICCSGSISSYYQYWKQLCCFIVFCPDLHLFFFNLVFCWLLLTEICAKQLSGSRTLPVPKQATGGVTQAQICVRNEVRALINLSKPTVSLTNQTSRSICPSEPAAVNKHYNVHYSFVVKGYLSQAVVGGLLSYLLNHLVHFP